MKSVRAVGAVVCLLLGSACGPKKEESETRLPTLPVTLPDGAGIRAELATAPADQQRGLMFRTKLDADRGMLFVLPQAGNHPFWMFQTLIPLDIIWMDAEHRIVYISADTPPCPPEKGQDCPHYGGQQPAQYVLELAAGAAAAHRLKPGDRLQF